MMTHQPDPNSFQSERQLWLEAFARGIRPKKRWRTSEWMEKNFVVPAGPHKGKLIDFARTPHLREPFDMLSPDSPWTVVAVKKSSQTAFTTGGIAWLFSLFDSDDADAAMYVLPTVQSVVDFVKERLTPAIEGCKPIAERIAPQRSRDGTGSTTRTKMFPGGPLILTGANSATDLSSKVCRFAVADEVDRWPDDLDGQGDPMLMLDARQLSYTRLRQQKKLVISTPALKGKSRIDRAYEAGDQRIWVMPCPHCGAEIDFRFEHLRFERHAPHNAHYMAQCCGAQIDSWQQEAMVLAGRWKPTKPGQGRQPSYFINALSSLLTDWDTIAATYVEVEGKPDQEKGFVNLTLGESYEEYASDLDPAKIVKAAEDYPRNVVPPTVGRLVFAVDTQDDRFEWALWGFGPPATSVTPEQWLIAGGVIPGDLATPAPWQELADTAGRAWPHAGGKMIEPDLCVIDSGGHWTQDVYKFVRGKRKWRALKGASDRNAPIIGTPRRVDVKSATGRLLYRVPLYFTNTHDLKTWLSHALKALEEGKHDYPGRIHLAQDLVDEAYVRQLTAEVLIRIDRRNGKSDMIWQPISGQRNEGLDLAVYARAFAFGAFPNGLGIDRIDRQQWTEILEDRHGARKGQQDLFSGPLEKPSRPVAAEPEASAPAETQALRPPTETTSAAARLAAIARRARGG
jgi:phage terminase large subunit GpA-like protein